MLVSSEVFLRADIDPRREQRAVTVLFFSLFFCSFVLPPSSIFFFFPLLCVLSFRSSLRFSCSSNIYEKNRPKTSEKPLGNPVPFKNLSKRFWNLHILKMWKENLFKTFWKPFESLLKLFENNLTSVNSTTTDHNLLQLRHNEWNLLWRRYANGWLDHIRPFIARVSGGNSGVRRWQE